MKSVLCLLVSGAVSVMFTSANVVAQAPKIAVEKRVGDQAAGNEVLVPGVMVKGARPRQPADPAAVARARKANLDNMIQQSMRQARPLVRAELIFVREVCETSVEQLRRINQDAEVALKEMATKLAESQQGRVRIVGDAGVRGNVQAARPLDALALLREGLKAVMKKDLSAEQFSHYQTEVEKRDENRKRSAVHYLVEAMDRELYLSDEQRVKLTESLSSHWDDSWSMSLEYLLYGNQFYPVGIDPHVTPYLDVMQKKIWQGVQRVGAIGGFSGVWGGFMNDSDALEVELGEVKKAEADKNLPLVRIPMKNIAKEAATKK